MDLEQETPFYEKVLHVDNTPVYVVQAVEESMHPAPFVLHPAKKLLQSELVVRVLGACEHAFATQADDKPLISAIFQHFYAVPPDIAVVMAPQKA